MKTVLYAEDREDDRFFFGRACQRCGFANEVVLRMVENGSEAIAFLEGADTAPDLVILDLKMPVKNGFDVLEWIRGRAELAGVPVVVLTSSSQEVDRARADELGASRYLVKAMSLTQLGELVSSLFQEFLFAGCQRN